MGPVVAEWELDHVLLSRTGGLPCPCIRNPSVPFLKRR